MTPTAILGPCLLPQGSEDWDYGGHGSNWNAMWQVLPVSKSGLVLHGPVQMIEACVDHQSGNPGPLVPGAAVKVLARHKVGDLRSTRAQRMLQDHFCSCQRSLPKHSQEAQNRPWHSNT